MATLYILCNHTAGDGVSLENATVPKAVIYDRVKRLDIRQISNHRVFLRGLEKEDSILLVGGDGTLNRFVNDIQGIDLPCDIFYFPGGTGNDFARDLGCVHTTVPFPVNRHLQHAPQVTVKNKTYRFLNGVGYGIDGYCCATGDELRTRSKKKVNYAAIAIKGLLFHYRPTNATVTVDGKTYTYRNVWLAPTMNGRFYGGGMMPTPSQKRNTGILSVMVFHDCGKWRTLCLFPSLFKGKHIRHTKQVDILTGRCISVSFDRPVALQIDGETLRNVSSYTAVASVPSNAAVG
ncbi:MAG: diacylglycerol kinase family protein [Ruminococcaceae bacterium]|nr:diacylglycerol kinase family protein [Oscillospiraceae bacterium]